MNYATTLPRGYLSVSQVAQYMKCGEAYRRRYILEQSMRPTAALVQGRCVHKAAEALHVSMMGASKDPISKEEMLQVYSDAHDAEIDEVEVDLVDLVENTPDRIKAEGLRLSSIYHQVAIGLGRDDKTGLPLPRVYPVAAEKVYQVDLHPENSEPIPFLAIIDLEEELAIADLKCKSRPSPITESSNSLQLSLYAHITGKYDVRLDQLIKPSGKLPARFIRTQTVRFPNETQHALDIVAEVAEDIVAGRFRRTNPENWWCSDKWCNFWSVCRGRKR